MATWPRWWWACEMKMEPKMSPLVAEPLGQFSQALGLRFLFAFGLFQCPLYKLAEVEGGRDALFGRKGLQLVFKALWDRYAGPLFAHVLSLSFLHAHNSIRQGLVDNQTFLLDSDLFSLTINQLRRIVCVGSN